MAAFLLQICSTLPRVNPLSRGSDAKPSQAGFLAGAALLSTAGCGWMLGHDKRQDAAANALAAIRGTIERTAFRLAALPEDGARPAACDRPQRARGNSQRTWP